VLGDEVELGEGADLFAVDAGLPGVGERFQRPAFRQIGSADAPLTTSDAGLLSLSPDKVGVVLRPWSALSWRSCHCARNNPATNSE
jgi:hypothetical protein